MTTESAFALNLRIGIATLVGAFAGLLVCLLQELDFLQGLSIGSLVSAGVLLASYVIVPAQPNGRRG